MCTWGAFATLVEANNGIFGGCWCMGFHAKAGDQTATPAPNCERKLELVRTGTAHAALVFDGDDCLGWAQFGTPDEALGFVRYRKIGKHRWVMTVEVDAKD